MPLSQFARRGMSHGLKSMAAGKEIADVVDAGSGTLSAPTVNRLTFLLNDRAAAGRIVTAINAGTAITGQDQVDFAHMLCHRGIAKEVADALAL